MKDLRLTPHNHKIVLYEHDPDYENNGTNVSFTLEDADGEIYLSKQEIKQIAKWFTKLAEKMENSK
jgi:hypothetical protein